MILGKDMGVTSSQTLCFIKADLIVAIEKLATYLLKDCKCCTSSQVQMVPVQVLIDPGLLLWIGWVPVVSQLEFLHQVPHNGITIESKELVNVSGTGQ